MWVIGAGGTVGSSRVLEEGLVPAGCRRKGWFRQGAGGRVGSSRVPEEGWVSVRKGLFTIDCFLNKNNTSNLIKYMVVCFQQG